MKTNMTIRNRRRRGITLLEAIISLLIFSGVAMFVSHVYILSARSTTRSLASLPAETNTYRALDRMRPNLLAARINTINVSDAGDEITFMNGGTNTRSRYAYNSATRKLLYQPDIDSVTTVAVGEFESVQFEVANLGRNIGVTVELPSRGSRNETIAQTYTDWITVRN